MIAGDLNQNIASKQIQQFFNKIVVMDAHQWCKQINWNSIDHTDVRGFKPIGTIALSHGMLEHIDRCRLLECNDIMLTYHRSCLIDLNLEDYFQDQMISWD